MQTVLYIYCFHHGALLSTEAGRDQFHSLRFDLIIECRLNPLKVGLEENIQNMDG